jgi:hypothetical protein
VDLRDRFAIQFAAALTGAFPHADEIARRAYDLADALLTERARRIERDERAALIEEGGAPAALLDEPAPPLEDDDLEVEPPYDPAWDLDERRPYPSPSRPPGPGLAWTQPAAEAADGRERSAG